jgi:hypothetical protein
MRAFAPASYLALSRVSYARFVRSVPRHWFVSATCNEANSYMSAACVLSEIAQLMQRPHLLRDAISRSLIGPEGRLCPPPIHKFV